MRSSTTRLLVCVVLVGAFAAGSIALVAGPDNPRRGGFKSCPVPPCLAPCAFPPEPEVQCKVDGGEVVTTSFACCCCGGGGNFFRFLK